MRRYTGPYPDPELSLYGRSLYGVYELLEQIHLQHPPLTSYGREERWSGIAEYYRVMGLILKRKPGIAEIPFICRQIGNT